jgi:hypothetical protein
MSLNKYGVLPSLEKTTSACKSRKISLVPQTVCAFVKIDVLFSLNGIKLVGVVYINFEMFQLIQSLIW